MTIWTLFSIALTFSAAEAAVQPNLQPRWVKQPIAHLRPNTSFLSDYSKRAPEETVLDQLIDQGSANAIRGEYEAVTQSYELKKLQGLSDPDAERGFVAHISGLAKGIVNKIRDYQRNRGREKALALSRNVKMRQEFQSTPVRIVGALAAAASDTPIELQLHETTRLVARANVGESVGRIEFSSPLGNGNFEYTPKAKERYQLSLARAVPLTDVTSSFSYTGTSNVFTASMQKPLTDTLVCVVDSSKTMDPGNTWNESIRLVYGFRF